MVLGTMDRWLWTLQRCTEEEWGFMHACATSALELMSLADFECFIGQSV